MQRLQEQYVKEIAPLLQKEFSLVNKHQVPKITQVIVHVGVGKNFRDSKQVEAVRSDLEKMTGQAVVETKARKSIAGFKLREGQVVGLQATLRGERMYSFLDKLINIALPRVRDFRGIPAIGFDGNGNFNLGLKDQTVFPEVPPESVSNIFGLQVSISTSTKDDVQAKALLKAFRFPFTS